ncbi:hypothetical protein Vadar_018064 [Vaccinium darrowii]|uniref:Uncharacterized protein n=1 Tax=Vaccinium darrowii TaxID=229202 RepID=A0ACB7Z573_9ERIC|nr:hypothetical protein Vadar_018064 [Vaccinium darrowii]
MAEALLIPAAKGILEGLLSLAKDPVTGQIKQAWGFKQDLKKLCRRLETIQGLLEAAENQNVTSKPILAAWLKHLKAATCDAENVLDELAYEDLRRNFFFEQEMELSLVGLQSAGKTSLVNAITTGGHSEDRIPTVCILSNNKIVIRLSALYKETDVSQHVGAVLPRVSAIFELHDLLTKPSLSGIPLLVLGNKINKSEAISTQALMDQLGLESINEREVCCYMISCKDCTHGRCH